MFEQIKRLAARALTTTAAVAVTMTVLGCNTIEGAGRDVENAGDAVEDTARDAKD